MSFPVSPKYNSTNLKSSVLGDFNTDCAKYLPQVLWLNSLSFQYHLPSIYWLKEFCPGRPKQWLCWVSFLITAKLPAWNTQTATMPSLSCQDHSWVACHFKIHLPRTSLLISRALSSVQSLPLVSILSGLPFQYHFPSITLLNQTALSWEPLIVTCSLPQCHYWVNS